MTNLLLEQRMSDQRSDDLSPEQFDTPINLSAAFHALWTRRPFIAKMTAGALAISIAIAFIVPATYTATASFVPPSTSGPAGGLASSLSALAILGPVKNSGELYVGVLKSRSVADKMLDRFDLMRVYHEKKRTQAIKKLQANTAVDADLKSSIISIRVSDRDPVRAQNMANAYLEEVRVESGGLSLTESSQRRRFFEERLRKEKDDLADAEVALKQTQEHTGLIAPAGQTASQIQAVAQLRAQIAGRQVHLASLLHDETDQNPDVLRIRGEVADLQGQVARMENGASRAGFGDIPAAQVPGLELDYIRRSRDVKYHETLFEIIAKQYEAARIDEANEPPLQVLDRAVIPDMKSGPPRTLIAFAGLFLGLLTSCVWVLIRARLESN